MGKICWINGQPYLISLPRGGNGENDRHSQWDKMINFLGENCDDIFHWSGMYSWCQEVISTLDCTVRGYHSARYWNLDNAMDRGENVGFRPVLAPLDPGTMKPDPSLLDDILDGTRIALTSLYMDGEVIAEPQNPTDEGDVAYYVPGAEITLGNRDECPGNWLHVIKHRDLLWADRNILAGISWDQLKSQGFVGEV